MSINLVQWEGSTVTPKLDAIMYDDGSYGIIKGCAITHQGTNLLKIANGFIKIAGRLIEIAEETIQCQVSASGTVNGQLWLRLDLSSVTPAVFMTEAATVLTPLTQNADCNFQNGIYELQLATYNIDESVITNLVETAPELERLRTALDNIDLAANKVTYDNTHSGLTATKVQGAIDEINDNLSGFKYYPIGTAIVGLVADNSAYTDANGNYVLADSATGRGMIDNITYKSISSTEKTCGEVGADTACPFKPALTDKNASKQRTWGKYYISSKGLLFDIDDYEIKYKKIAVYNNSNVSDTLKFYNQNLTLLGSQSISNKVWTQYYNIPSGTYYIYIDTTGSSGWYYSLLTH